MADKTYEVCVLFKDGRTQYFDPVVNIIIDNTAHKYDIAPEEVESISIKELYE